MTRVPPLTGRQTPLFVRALGWISRRIYGQEPLPLRLLAYNPRFVLAYLGASGFSLGRTRLRPELRMLAMHLVAARNGCSWCLDFAGAFALRQGIPAEKLLAVTKYQTDPQFSEAERAVLAFADEATQVGAAVSDTTFAAVQAHLTPREIVELTVGVAIENFYNRLNIPLGVEAQGFCAVPFARHATRAAAATHMGA